MSRIPSSNIQPDHEFGPECPNYPHGCLICLAKIPSADECEFGCMPMDHGEDTDDEPTQDLAIRNIVTPHDIMEFVETPYRYKIPELTEAEQIEAARHYLETKYGAKVSPNWHIEMKLPYPTPEPEVVERQLGVYDKMIRRDPDGPDPLVQEPKD
jgi:hypothetical protein